MYIISSFGACSALRCWDGLLALAPELLLLAQGEVIHIYTAAYRH